jgi:two-component system chemotaxis response regulator CheB
MIPEIPSKIEMVVIGCSAGGVDALKHILPRLPANYGRAVVVVIHLPPDKDSMMPEIFGHKCAMPVREAQDKETIQINTVYFACPDYHLLIETDGTFSLSFDDLVNFSRPSIDVLFESAAIAYKDRLLGVVLTGANEDGAQGLRQVVESGGMAAVEDPETAEHPFMPEAALKAARPQVVLGIEELGRWLAEGGKIG